MKAMMVQELGGPEVLKYVETALPTCGDDEVLMKVEMTSVNFADVKARYGKKGNANLPFIPGLDAVGTVVEVGRNVANVTVGERVVAFPSSGSYAEYAVANQNLTFPLPEGIDLEQAAACPVVGMLSYMLVHKIARVQQGEVVLVHAAAGGVGTTLIQLLKAAGAGTIIGTVGTSNKKAIALEAGADYAINYEEESFMDHVHTLTNGQGVDVVFDSISGVVAEKSLECLQDYGRLVHFGNSSGETGSFMTKQLHASCRSVLGFSLGTTRKKKPHLLQEPAAQLFEALRLGTLTINIGNVFSLDEAALAHEWLESRKSTGKILLRVSQ